MKPGDRVRIHMHDTPDGFRIDLDDLTSGESGSMTVFGRQRLRAHPLHTPTSSTCQVAPYVVSIRNTARATHAETRGRHTRTTSPSPTRSGTLRTASRSTRTSTAQSQASRMPGVSTPMTATTSAYPDPIPRSSRSTDACPATETGTPSRTRTTGREPTPTLPAIKHCIRARSCSPARRRTTERRTTRRSPSRPTCHGSRRPIRRTTRRSATRPRARTA